MSLQNHTIQSNRRVAFTGDGRRGTWLGGQSDLLCALHSILDSVLKISLEVSVLLMTRWGVMRHHLAL